MPTDAIRPRFGFIRGIILFRVKLYPRSVRNFLHDPYVHLSIPYKKYRCMWVSKPLINLESVGSMALMRKEVQRGNEIERLSREDFWLKAENACVRRIIFDDINFFRTKGWLVEKVRMSVEVDFGLVWEIHLKWREALWPRVAFEKGVRTIQM